MANTSTPRVTHLADPEALAHDSLVIEGEAYRHLFRSRRLHRDTCLRVVDGRGRARRGAIVTIDKKHAVVELHEALGAGEPERSVTLIAAAIRPERANILVEKATELGVAKIIFTATERTPRSFGEGRLERLGRIAASAVEQSHRSWLPEIRGVMPLGEALDLAHTTTARTFALVPGAIPLATACSDFQESGSKESGPKDPMTLLIGPEGGWGADDLELFLSHEVTPAGLGATVLRAETAALAALAVVLCR